MTKHEDDEQQEADWSDFGGWSPGAAQVTETPRNGAPSVAELDDFYAAPKRGLFARAPQRSRPVVDPGTLDYFIDEPSAPTPVPAVAPADPFADGPPVAASAPEYATASPFVAPTVPAVAPVTDEQVALPAAGAPVQPPVAPVAAQVAAAVASAGPKNRRRPTRGRSTDEAVVITKPTPVTVREGHSGRRDAKSPSPAISQETLRAGIHIVTSLVVAVAACVAGSTLGQNHPVWLTIALVTVVTGVSAAALRRAVVFGVPVLLVGSAAAAFPGAALIGLPVAVSLLSVAYVVLDKLRKRSQ